MSIVTGIDTKCILASDSNTILDFNNNSATIINISSPSISNNTKVHTGSRNPLHSIGEYRTRVISTTTGVIEFTTYTKVKAGKVQEELLFNSLLTSVTDTSSLAIFRDSSTILYKPLFIYILLDNEIIQFQNCQVVSLVIDLKSTELLKFTWSIEFTGSTFIPNIVKQNMLDFTTERPTVSNKLSTFKTIFDTILYELPIINSNITIQNTSTSNARQKLGVLAEPTRIFVTNRSVVSTNVCFLNNNNNKSKALLEALSQANSLVNRNAYANTIISIPILGSTIDITIGSNSIVSELDELGVLNTVKTTVYANKDNNINNSLIEIKYN